MTEGGIGHKNAICWEQGGLLSLCCSRRESWGGLEISVDDGIVHTKQQPTYGCCAKLALTPEQEDDALKLKETGVGKVCRGVCEYQAEANMAGLPLGVPACKCGARNTRICTAWNCWARERQHFESGRAV